MARIDGHWTTDLILDTFPSIWSSESIYQIDARLEFDLFTATTFGEYEYVKKLIGCEKISVNQKNQGQWTALMYAIFYGHSSLVELLLQHNASVHDYNNKGQNGLMIASRYGNERLATRLILAGGILEARDCDDWTALHHAIYSGDFNVVRTLLERGANPNACDRKTWRSPLMYASHLGDYNIVEILLRHGATPGFVNTKGQTASILARDAGLHNVADLIDRWATGEKIGLRLMDGPKAIDCSLFTNNSPRTSNRRMLIDATAGSGMINDLESILARLGLASFAQIFQEQQVDFTTFLSLSDQDLKDCGITKLGPRLKIMAGIDRWHNNAPLTTGPEAAYANKLAIELNHSKEDNKSKDLALKEANKLKEKELKLRGLAEMKILETNSKMQELHDRMRNLNSHLIYALHLAAPFQMQPLQDKITACSTQLDEIIRMTDSHLQSNLPKNRYMNI